MKRIFLIFLLVTFACAGCRGIRTTFPKPIESFVCDTSDEIIRTAIINACESSDWAISEISPHTFHAIVRPRRHMIAVTIEYSDTWYSIRYLGSENMLYSSEDGRIHKKYNAWVQKLDIRIRREISKLKRN